jgi:hypothetical protein
MIDIQHYVEAEANADDLYMNEGETINDIERLMTSNPKEAQKRYEIGQLTLDFTGTSTMIYSRAVEAIAKIYSDICNCDAEATYNYIQDNYEGCHDSWAEFARELHDDIPEHLEDYIEWGKVGAELKRDYFEVKGLFFRNV